MMMKTVVTLLLTAALPGISARPATAQGAADGCALLQAAEIQTLAGSSKTDGLAKVFPGMDPSLARKGFLSKVKPGDPNVAGIPDISDAAIYEADAPIRVSATALANGYMLIVTFEPADARARKDQVIALLKAAAGRV
jgi:hypothetical protein